MMEVSIDEGVTDETGLYAGVLEVGKGMLGNGIGMLVGMLVGIAPTALHTSVATPRAATAMIGAGLMSLIGLQPGRWGPVYVTSSAYLTGSLHSLAFFVLGLKDVHTPTSSLP